MQITFDIEKFTGRGGDRSLTNVLCYLKRHGCFPVDKYVEIERITCRTPSSALRYCRYFATNGISPSSEDVFLKNPSIAVRYLKMVNRPEFSDPSIQKRFRRKFKSNAQVAYEWARAFNTRLSEDEETVFRKDLSAAKNYAMQVIRGKFPEKVHSMLLLASYEDLSPWDKRCLAEYLKYSETH